MLGNVVASFSTVNFELLPYRHLERDKIRSLKYYKGNFEGKISLSLKVVSEIHWWINNIDIFCDHINNIPNPDITINTSDGNLTCCGISNRISPSGDIWHKAELDHINVLELKGSMAYINNMGSIKSET